MIANVDEIKKGIEAAERELSELMKELKRYDEIRAKAADLESFIKLGKKWLGVNPEPKPNNEPPPGLLFSTDDGLVDKPHVEGVCEILRDRGNEPLSLRALSNEFHARKWKLSPKNGIQVLRAATLRHPEMFERLLDGNTLRFKLTDQVYGGR